MDEGNRKFIQAKLGGIHVVGDLSQLPDAKTPDCNNVTVMPGPRVEARPGIASLNVATGGAVSQTNVSLMRSYDRTTRKEVLLAMENYVTGGPTNNSKLWKTTDGVSWTSVASLGTATTNPIRSYTEAFGTAVWVQDTVCKTWAGSTQIGDTFGEWDASNFTPATLASFLDRIFIGGHTVSLLHHDDLHAYVPSLAGAAIALNQWGGTGVTFSTRTINGVAYCSIAPNASTGTRNITWVWGYPTGWSQALGGVTQILTQLRNRSTTTSCPLTIKLVPSSAGRSTAYALNRVLLADTPNGYRYRVTVAGTTAVGVPAWPTTVGATVADGTLTWMCEGAEAISSLEVNLPPATTLDDFTSYWMVVDLGIDAGENGVVQYISWGNSSYTSWPTDGVDVARVDGLANTSTLKKNRGQGQTTGYFKYEFPNWEDASTNTVAVSRYYLSRLAWTDFRIVQNGMSEYRLSASNYWDLDEYPGQITAVCSLAGRLLAFKQRGVWVFSGSADPNLPINLERTIDQIGCRGPKAFDLYDGKVFTVGDAAVYAIGLDGGYEEVTDDGVREAMFASIEDYDWTAPTYGPQLRIDPKRRVMFVIPDGVTIWVFSFDTKQWTKWSVTTGRIESLCFAFDKMWLYSTTHGVGYFSDSATVDTKADASTTAIAWNYDLPVTEILHPKRDLLVESIDVRHQIRAASPSMTVSVSRDGGSTYPQSNTVTLNQSPAETVTITDRVDLWQTSDNLRVRMSGTGGTKTNLRIVSVSLALQRLSDDDNMEDPVSSTSSNL